MSSKKPTAPSSAELEAKAKAELETTAKAEELEAKAEAEELETTAKAEDGAYKVPENEKHLVHVELEKKRFNMATGERLSKPTVQKYTEKQWAISKGRLPDLGFNSIKVLHDPTAK